MVRTKNVVFDDIYIDAVSTNVSVRFSPKPCNPFTNSSQSLPKNTDGFDTLNVDGLTVTNTRVNVGDDCFSPKPNTTNILVKNLWCNGTHGVSMGSIGQYPGVKDYISNAWIENVTLLNGENGARLKAWAGPNVGYGYIDNITYKDIHIENTDHPVVLDQVSAITTESRVRCTLTSRLTVLLQHQRDDVCEVPKQCQHHERELHQH